MIYFHGFLFRARDVAFVIFNEEQKLIFLTMSYPWGKEEFRITPIKNTTDFNKLKTELEELLKSK